MKKALSLLATVITVISLASCGSSSSSGQTFGNNNTNNQSNTQNGTGNQDNSLSEDDLWNNEYFEGEVGETMSTAWFDFNVTSATLYSEYNGNTPSEGYQFLVLEMWLKNTFNESVPMYWYDFPVDWDDPDAWVYPVSMTVDGKEFTEEEEEYSLRRAGSSNLVMVYEVAEGYDEFYVYFGEEYEDGTTGNILSVYLTPEQK